MISRFLQLKDLPENGIIVFCGKIIIRGDKTEFEYHTIVPPIPVKSFSYRCNSQFETEDAESLSINNDVYGLIVMDLHEACWGTLSGSDVRALGAFDSIVPNKHSQGGQSAQRFERLRDIAINEFFVKLGDRTSDAFTPALKEHKLKGILIGGCGMTKDAFVKGNFMNHELRKIIVGTFDTQYTNEFGLTELAQASKGKLSDNKMDRQKQIFDEFLIGLAKDTGRSIYGADIILEQLNHGQLKKVLISSKRNDLYVLAADKSSEKGTEIEIISSGSDSGSILDTAFGGMVAISRY